MLNFSQETIYSILCAVLPCAIYYIIRKIKGQKTSILPIIIFVLYIWQVYELTGAGGLSDIIYAPQGGDNQSIIKATINLVPFNIIERTFFLNILMLIPLGFLVPFIWKNYRKCYKTVLLGAGFSLLIEISQLITTRATDINDLKRRIGNIIVGYTKENTLLFGERMKKSADGNSDVIWYILLSFFGMFFLYYPFWFSRYIAPLIF